MAVLPQHLVLSGHWSLYAPVAACLLVLYVVFRALQIYSANRPYSGIPLISLPGKTAKDSWIYHGSETLTLGLQTTPEDQLFQVMTGTGPKVIIRNRHASEVTRNKHLSFFENFRVEFMTEYPGFEGLRLGSRGTLVRDTVVKKLTQSLGLVTDDLVEEATDSISDIFGEHPEWQTSEIWTDVQQMIARLSSRVFLGKPLCRKQRWLDIAKDYTTHVFGASRDLRAVPSLIRPVKHWLMPNCRALRNDIRDAQALIGGEVARRDAAARALLAQGQKPPKKSDAIAWFVEMAHERGQELSVLELVSYQLSLTLAAIHTTTDATCRALQHLCEHPHLIQPIRDEIVRVVGARGWAKTTLYQLRLLDSFLKESQRHSQGRSTLGRTATADVVLSNGIVIPKGTRLLLLGGLMDEQSFPDPFKFDAYRFLDQRDPDAATATSPPDGQQFVSISPDNLGFGYGINACPGRFFVANELKITLAHLLLKYDWSADPVHGKNELFELEATRMWDPAGKLRRRRRREEIDLRLVTG